MVGMGDKKNLMIFFGWGGGLGADKGWGGSCFFF